MASRSGCALAMPRIRSSVFASVVAAIGVALLVCPVNVRAQTIVEVGAGWNYPGTGPFGLPYTRGWTARVSVGPQLAQNFLLRIDATMSQFRDSVQFSPPCPSPGCTHAYYNAESVNVLGVVANGILNLDRRGIFYLIGGVGAYDVNARDHALHVGLSGGAGIAMPIGARLRAVAEARWNGLVGNTTGPSWFAPVTFGLRY